MGLKLLITDQSNDMSNLLEAKRIEREALIIRLRAEYPHLKYSWLMRQLCMIDAALLESRRAVREQSSKKIDDAQNIVRGLIAEIE